MSVLNLAHNQLFGEISLCQLPDSLTELNLSRNTLEGMLDLRQL
eukprot:CAMPEP_0201494050 /NCGR_PEP_ID=MMETSP0151_2-20130828/44535_1 /ASSEMBLY_ACC=CAM_ASM_000257 /TAXON_ID=200890 /ORGANISM="Paramoeba atlantica, Strain 621/1 / CCAP 1560/9" /LENGTH=43 /DNA_ID= /DNA_START= /DNA_END= /DNA_ORIENTATION=